MSMNRRNRAFRIIVLAIATSTIAWLAMVAGETDDLVSEIETELIPGEGTETAYGIPLSLESLPLFVEWWYTRVPLAEADPRYEEALSRLVAPCCDDNTAFRCCCESDGKACNIIRSGKGLAAYLILELDFDAEAIAESVLEWFRFARPDYYIAAELVARGIDPGAYGTDPTFGV